MAAIAQEVDAQIRELEQAAERHLVAGGSAVKGAAAEHDLLIAAEGARDFLLRAVQGEKGTLSELFGHNCQRWERLREIMDSVSLSDAADRRWQSLRDVVDMTESILKELGTFKGLGGPRSRWPCLGGKPSAEPRDLPLRVASGGEGGELRPEEADPQLPLALSMQPGAVTLLLREGISVENATWRVTSSEGGEAKAELVFSVKERRAQGDRADEGCAAKEGLHGDCLTSLNFGLELPKVQPEAPAEMLGEEASPAAEEEEEVSQEASDKASEEASTEASVEASVEMLDEEAGPVAEEDSRQEALEPASEEAPVESSEEAPAVALAEPCEASSEALVGMLPEEVSEAVAEEVVREEVVEGTAADAAALEACSAFCEKARDAVASPLSGGIADAGADVAPDRLEEVPEQEMPVGTTSTASPDDSAHEANTEKSDELGSSTATIDCSKVHVRNFSFEALDADRAVDFEPEEQKTLDMSGADRDVEFELEEQNTLDMSTLDMAAAALGVRSRGPLEAPSQQPEAPVLPPPTLASQPKPSPTLGHRCLVAVVQTAETAESSSERLAAPRKQRTSVEVPVELVPRIAAPPPSSASRPAVAALAASAHPPLARRGSAATLPRVPTMLAQSRPSTLSRDPNMWSLHPSASSASSGCVHMSTLPRHCSAAPVAAAAAPAAAPVRRPSMGSLVMPAPCPSTSAGGAPMRSAPGSPPVVHRTIGARPSQRMPVQRMESAPSGALHGVVRRETGHWEERRVVEVRTERLWVPHSCEEVAL